MRRSSPLLLLLFASFAPVYGQPDKELKKRVENDLYKKTPYVRSAKLEGCRLALSVDISYSSGFHALVGSLPAAMPTEGEMNPPFASGATSRNLIQFILDVGALDGTSVVLADTKRKEHKVLMLVGAKDSVTRVWSGKRDKTNNIDLTVNAKDGDRVAQTVRDVIAVCRR